MMEDTRRFVCRVEPDDDSGLGNGTGFHVANGYVISCSHVVDSATVDEPVGTHVTNAEELNNSRIVFEHSTPPQTFGNYKRICYFVRIDDKDEFDFNHADLAIFKLQGTEEELSLLPRSLECLANETSRLSLGEKTFCWHYTLMPKEKRPETIQLSEDEAVADLNYVEPGTTMHPDRPLFFKLSGSTCNLGASGAPVMRHTDNKIVGVHASGLDDGTAYALHWNKTVKDFLFGTGDLSGSATADDTPKSYLTIRKRGDGDYVKLEDLPGEAGRTSISQAIIAVENLLRSWQWPRSASGSFTHVVTEAERNEIRQRLPKLVSVVIPLDEYLERIDAPDF